jgi:hypothetical protein
MATAASTPFMPLNDLERLLMAAASGGDDARKAFEAALLTEPLYAATPEGDGTGDVVTLLSVEHRGALRATALFTAAERAAGVFGPDVRTVSWPGRVLLETVAENPAVLNPGQPYGVAQGDGRGADGGAGCRAGHSGRVAGSGQMDG